MYIINSKKILYRWGIIYGMDEDEIEEWFKKSKEKADKTFTQNIFKGMNHDKRVRLYRKQIVDIQRRYNRYMGRKIKWQFMKERFNLVRFRLSIPVRHYWYRHRESYYANRLGLRRRYEDARQGFATYIYSPVHDRIRHSYYKNEVQIIEFEQEYVFPVVSAVLWPFRKVASLLSSLMKFISVKVIAKNIERMNILISMATKSAKAAKTKVTPYLQKLSFMKKSKDTKKK